MERATISQAKELFRENFIGIDELMPMLKVMGLSEGNFCIPEINYSIAKLEKYSEEYILILGLSEAAGKGLSIATFRDFFGVDSDRSEPCFYNQDWYLHENFIKYTLNNKWYLLKKEVIEETRAIQPSEILKGNVSFPSAVLCTYTFFANYYINNTFLWYHDFIWCRDVDHNGDRIYIGKYNDIDGANKNGFSIHRHLALRDCYASIDVLKCKD
ncbi:MAG: hypothetical protein H6Q13_3541 [Bacteroidetes bacterium]|jgi:hypothetical protein|nr:hypothetical protein [Bacteroidota bacterium]